MRESRTYGSARGGRGNPVPYRYRCYSDPYMSSCDDQLSWSHGRPDSGDALDPAPQDAHVTGVGTSMSTGRAG